MTITTAESVPDSPFTTVELRCACSEDAPALARLLQQLASDEPLVDSKLLALRLAEHSTHREILVAERDGQVLGTCTINLIEHLSHNFARSAILEDVVVDADARGLGIGQALMQKAIERATSWGCYKVALSSNHKREEAHRFYENLGFKLHGYSLMLPLK
ncbi:GNAT family N-acetyltransferase [Pseudomonas sp. TTU2014-080ASC]|uniref:GNAT family N-acetyltransferase n=1 Tax=Pseudomonas sp. TTU2014-080ASC TaxID=1729724 RepID=UPI001F4CE57F|nr:GNAT family N-acetyltransferase [Pseudomonas sp. TTU2014-080ASC]